MILNKNHPKNSFCSKESVINEITGQESLEDTSSRQYHNSVLSHLSIAPTQL